MMRSVTLELLRHGPAHNQLLSPLTPYLALCGNHDAETVSVGFEHLQLMRRIEQLRYIGGVRMAAVARGEATQEVTRLLSSIRSLTAELATSDPLAEGRMVHLRLVLSASELALLPFELTNAYPGLAAQEQPLCLQSVMPVCLTREVRRVTATTLEWPKSVRILVIAAAPPQVSAVPIREHLQVLRAALAPYMVNGDVEEFEQSLTVLTEASLAAVRGECSRRRYTHVHVLAHGMGLDDAGSGESRFGLAFHVDGRPDEVDVVTGSRLAAALRCHVLGPTGQALSSPTVLTIASCDSANMGTVVAPGASVAHELHESGIPLVIGSQFPLSVKGSVVMTELIYRRLLNGDDPRVITHDLRQALHSECRETHDWASVVVYASLPADIDAQLARVRFDRAHVALEKVMSRVDALEKRRPSEGTKDMDQWKADRNQVRIELNVAMKRVQEAAPMRDLNHERVSSLGLLASAYKRVAWSLNDASQRQRRTPPQENCAPTQEPERPQGDASEELDHAKSLEEARHYYFACYLAGIRDSWPLVQYLALCVATDPDWKTPEGLDELKSRWTVARVMSLDALRAEDRQRHVWAHSSLAELWILAAAWDEPQRCEAAAIRHARELHEVIRLKPYAKAMFDMYSLYRQVLRYERYDWGTPAMLGVSRLLAAELKKRGAKEHWTHTDALF